MTPETKKILFYGGLTALAVFGTIFLVKKSNKVEPTPDALPGGNPADKPQAVSLTAKAAIQKSLDALKVLAPTVKVDPKEYKYVKAKENNISVWKDPTLDKYYYAAKQNDVIGILLGEVLTKELDGPNGSPITLRKVLTIDTIPKIAYVAKDVSYLSSFTY